MGLVRKAISSRAGAATRWAFLVARADVGYAHREITLRQGGLGAIAVGDEGKAVRTLKFTGCRDIALEFGGNV